jgi:ubiquinone/menaquinone biosynthesis C-methylase UbiE
MNARNSLANFRVYSSSEVAAHYSSLSYLTPCERMLFDKYLKPGMAILDAGVGGGRTTPHLSAIAGSYVGIDYSETMIEACRNRYPELRFAVSDAADLSAFPAEAFDAVVMAFNTIDYIVPEDRRRQCFTECWRVLKPGGVFLFSSHNPRSIIVRPGWEQNRVHSFVRRFITHSSMLYLVAVAATTTMKAAQSLVRASVTTLGRLAHRLSKSAFWTGEGHLMDAAHGGLLTHYWTPRKAINEVSQFAFELAEIRGDDYPRKSGELLTDWYYYVFAKANRKTRAEVACA